MFGKQSCKKLEEISLSNDTIQCLITKLMNNISSQMISNLKSCLHNMFSTQLDESTDVFNVSQLMVFVQWAFNRSIEKVILFCSPLQSNMSI